MREISRHKVATVYCILERAAHRISSLLTLDRTGKLHRLRAGVLLVRHWIDLCVQALRQRQVREQERLYRVRGLSCRSIRQLHRGEDGRMRRALRRGPLRQPAGSNVSPMRGSVPQGFIQPAGSPCLQALSRGAIRRCRGERDLGLCDTGLHRSVQLCNLLCASR